MPSGWGVTPPPFCITVPDVMVWTPGSIWCHVTVEPAGTVSSPGLNAMSLMFTVVPDAAAPVVVVVVFPLDAAGRRAARGAASGDRDGEGDDGEREERESDGAAEDLTWRTCPDFGSAPPPRMRISRSGRRCSPGRTDVRL